MNGESRGLPPRHMRREPLREAVAPERIVALPLISIPTRELIPTEVIREDALASSADILSGITNPPIPGLVYPEELAEE